MAIAVEVVGGAVGGGGGAATLAAGSVSSGAYVAGSIADGAAVTIGAKADAKSTATDTTAITAMSVWKQISASVQSLASGIVLGAGTALIGKVKTKCIVAAGSTLTRPANATPYSIGDSISDNATAGSVTANTVTIADLAGEPVMVERVRVVSNDTGIAAKSIRLWLFNSNPTSSTGVVGGDNAAFSNKQAGFVGTLSGTFRTFSDGSTAVLVPDEGSRIFSTPGAAVTTMWWQLQALEAFTPSANSTTFIPTFEGFQGGAN